MRAKDNPAVPGIGSGPYGAEPGFDNDDCAPEYGPRFRRSGSNIPFQLHEMLAEDPTAMRRFMEMTKEEQDNLIHHVESGAGIENAKRKAIDAVKPKGAQ